MFCAAVRLGDTGPVLAVGRDLRAVSLIQQTGPARGRVGRAAGRQRPGTHRLHVVRQRTMPLCTATPLHSARAAVLRCCGAAVLPCCRVAVVGDPVQPLCTALPAGHPARVALPRSQAEQPPVVQQALPDSAALGDAGAGSGSGAGAAKNFVAARQRPSGHAVGDVQGFDADVHGALRRASMSAASAVLPRSCRPASTPTRSAVARFWLSLNLPMISTMGTSIITMAPIIVSM